MNENKTLFQHAKGWWDDNKTVIKAGLICGVLGVMYGMVEGGKAQNELWLKYGFERAKASHEPCDEYGLTEANCDDPELLELARMENENS